MSLGYADRLSWREDLGGTLGDPELHDSDADVARKVAHLARYVSGLSGRLGVLPRHAQCLASSGCMPALAMTGGLEPRGSRTSQRCSGLCYPDDRLLR